MTEVINDLNLRRFTTKLEQDILPYLDIRAESYQKKASLGLTGLFLASEAGMPLADAKKYVVDSGEDLGIDGIYYNSATQILYFVQTKFRTNQSRSIDQGEILKFKRGIEKIIQFNVDGASKKVKDAYRDIVPALEDINTRIKICIVTTSKVDIEPNCKSIIVEFCNKLNELDTVFSWDYIKFDRAFQMARFFSQTEATSVDINLYGMGILREPHTAYYGYISGEEVAKWVKKYGTRLFEQNVRFTLQNSDVNEGVLNTIKSNPKSFWYLNNGITAISARVKITPAENNPRKIRAEGMNIVNGAQTAGMLARAMEDGIDLSNIKVNFRVISLEGTMPGFDEDVTRANNTQNELNALDFVSLDPKQDLIRTELSAKGYDYVFKRGAEIDEELIPIEVKDAAVALACADEDISISVQAKRYVSGLWSNIKSEPYTKIFHDGISGDEIIRKWSVYNWCLEEIKEIRASSPKEEALIFSHGDKFICHCVFRILSERGIRLSNEKEVRDVIKEIAYELPIVYKSMEKLGYPATTFKNKNNQVDIKKKLFNNLIKFSLNSD